MSLRDVLRLHRARLRSRAMRAQDGCAVLGLAIGVALLFASQIASAGLARSVGEMTRAVVGRARWELSARGPNGMSEALLQEVRRQPVRLAIPLLEDAGVASGPAGTRSIELLGAQPREAQLAGTILRHLSAAQLARTEAVALPATLAAQLGVKTLGSMQLQLGGEVTSVPVGLTLGARQIGGLAGSPLVFVPLAYAQQLTHMQGRLSRIFLAPQPGRAGAVHAALARLAALDHLSLEPSGWESTLFGTAFHVQEQSQTIFSAIAALVGFLLAANAILITVPSRRRLIESLRLAGATRGKALQIMCVDAALIGALACALGLALGDLLARTLFTGSPGYLSLAFPVGSARMVSWQSVAISIAAGMIAALIGVLWPLRDLLALGRARPGRSRSRPMLLRWQLGAGLLSIALAPAILLASPALAGFGALMLMIALVCLLAPLFELALAALAALQRSLGGAAGRIAILELHNPLTRVRTLAIVATAAAASFGVLALAGAQSNLRQGLARSARDIDASAQIWVAPAGQSNAFATVPMRGASTIGAALQRVPGVAGVGAYGGVFLDWGPRRLWVLAPPQSAAQPIPASQFVGSGLRQATRALRAGEDVVLSQQLAQEHDLRVGQRFTLPSPQPIRVRLAGLITNLGWPPGAILLSHASYVRAWPGVPPSAYEIDAMPGVAPARLSRRVARALAGHPALRVETSAQRVARHEALGRQGLSRLTQIRVLIVIASLLAIAGALGTLLWQRRERSANMRVLGCRPRVLWLALCCESATLLATGCAIGAIFGLMAQMLLSHALSSITGFPIVFDIEVFALANCAVIAAVAGALAAAVGYRVANVPPSTAGAAV